MARASATRCETFDGDGCRDRHRARSMSDDQEDRRTGAAVGAVNAGGDRVATPCPLAHGMRPRGVPRGGGGATCLPRSELEAPAIRTTTPTAIGTARASAGSCISIAASATPSGRRPFEHGHTKSAPTSAVAIRRVSPVLTCGGSATASGSATAASSPPSHTPRNEAAAPGTFVRASASTPSTWSAAGHRHLPLADMDAHQTIVTATLAAPAPRRQNACRGKLARKPCVCDLRPQYVDDIMTFAKAAHSS